MTFVNDVLYGLINWLLPSFSRGERISLNTYKVGLQLSFSLLGERIKQTKTHTCPQKALIK